MISTQWVEVEDSTGLLTEVQFEVGVSRDEVFLNRVLTDDPVAYDAVVQFFNENHHKFG